MDTALTVVTIARDVLAGLVVLAGLDLAWHIWRRNRGRT